jgi:ribosomal protein S24E
MDFTITKEEKKPLMHRRDVSARISYEASTPSRMDIRKAAAEHLKAKEETVLITKILPEVGSPSANVELRIYDNEQVMKDIEYNYTLVRHGLAEKKSATGAPASK